MKQRIATAVIGLTIFFAILALYQTIFLNISAAVIIFLALHEMFHVTGVWENKALSAVCLLFGCALPFFNIEQARQWLVYGEAVFALAIFGILLFYHESLHYTKAATAFAATSVISYTTSVLIWLRQASETPLEGIYYTLLAFGLAWLTDTGAYLFGITMGKHKLAPENQPQKNSGRRGGRRSVLRGHSTAAVVVLPVGRQKHLGRPAPDSLSFASVDDAGRRFGFDAGGFVRLADQAAMRCEGLWLADARPWRDCGPV